MPFERGDILSPVSHRRPEQPYTSLSITYTQEMCKKMYEVHSGDHGDHWRPHESREIKQGLACP